MIPTSKGQAQPTLDAAARASEVRDDLAQTQLQAIDHMTKKYQEEADSKLSDRRCSVTGRGDQVEDLLRAQR